MSSHHDTEQSGVFGYCHDCDWFATPDDHEYADVLTAAEAHTTFEHGHTTTVGASEGTVEEAELRSIEAELSEEDTDE